MTKTHEIVMGECPHCGDEVHWKVDVGRRATKYAAAIAPEILEGPVEDEDSCDNCEYIFRADDVEEIVEKALLQHELASDAELRGDDADF
tara:strand:+ start:313 stop:582 length:270 start_codon:yes stop_codon:yes gene_type:complete